MKYKKGDRVKIINEDDIQSCKPKGKVVIVTIVDPLSEILTYFVENHFGVGCWVSEGQIEKAKLSY